MFEISPDAFHRIHIRRVGRQIGDQDLVVLGFDTCAHEHRAMHLRSIEDDRQLLADRCLQGIKKLDDLQSLDRAQEQMEVVPPVAQADDHRKCLSVEDVMQDGRLAPRRLGACPTRPLRQNQFVVGNDHSALLRSAVFCSGHLLAFQFRTVSSLRSRACLVGRYALQTRGPSNRETEEGTIFTANFASISCAIRGNVHNSAGKSADIAPSWSSRTSSRRCTVLSRSGRPKCGT